MKYFNLICYRELFGAKIFSIEEKIKQCGYGHELSFLTEKKKMKTTKSLDFELSFLTEKKKMKTTKSLDFELSF